MSAEINARNELPESRMKGNFHVRFGGGRLEKGQQCHLASRLPNNTDFLLRSVLLRGLFCGTAEEWRLIRGGKKAVDGFACLEL